MEKRQVNFYKSLSADSDKVKKLLDENNVKYTTFPCENDDDEPGLFVSGKRCRYDGYKEISEFLSLMVQTLEKTK